MVAGILSEILGPRGWLTDPSDRAIYSTDWAGRSDKRPIGVARPATTEEVAKTVSVCHEAGMAMVPQGGRTGLVMGNFPHCDQSIVLSLSRINHIDPIDPSNFCVSLGAGAILEQLHQQLDGTGLMFPMRLGSEGSAQIGGLIASNAGGNLAFRYGMMMDHVLGLEVVLPDGRVWNGMRSLIKDNAGFQLRRLFCGAEGRLGIVTRAVLRLQTAPRNRVTGFFAFRSMRDVLRFGTNIRLRLGEVLTGLEFMNDTVLDMALNTIPDLTFPLSERAGAYLLVELSTSLGDLDLSSMMEEAFVAEFEAGTVSDGVIAQNEVQRHELWRLREELPEGQKRNGPQAKHDISVPVSRVADFLETMGEEARRRQPDVRICAFGHLGDGNIHYNYSVPGKDPTDPALTALSDMVYDRLDEMNGSFAAEHGLGFRKTGIADKRRPATERDLMRLIHDSLDPQNLMNPGVSVR